MISHSRKQNKLLSFWTIKEPTYCKKFSCVMCCTTFLKKCVTHRKKGTFVGLAKNAHLLSRQSNKLQKKKKKKTKCYQKTLILSTTCFINCLVWSGLAWSGLSLAKLLKEVKLAGNSSWRLIMVEIFFLITSSSWFGGCLLCFNFFFFYFAKSQHRSDPKNKRKTPLLNTLSTPYNIAPVLYLLVSYKSSHLNHYKWPEITTNKTKKKGFEAAAVEHVIF